MQGEEEYKVNGGSSLFWPRDCANDAEWKHFHLTHAGGVSVRRAAAQHQRKAPLKPAPVAWDVLPWQTGKPMVLGAAWTEVHLGAPQSVLDHCTEGAGFYDGAEVVQCEDCFEVVVPKRQPGDRSASWKHMCPALSTDTADGDRKATRERCTRTILHFGFQLHLFPELDTALPELERHDLIDVLFEIV